MTAITNTTVGHYEILAPLGAGGMGEVWLAEDTRLKRKVALKLLPAELTTDAERVRRFEQEAQAASALNHPNIITVHDIGASARGRFIVMEMVAGRTLRKVIAADNSLGTLLTLGQQMAKALSAAHTAGITHRDIKPDNIMVRDDGYVKVLDFSKASCCYRLPPTRQRQAGRRRKRKAAITRPLKLPGNKARNRGNYAPPPASRACGNNKAREPKCRKCSPKSTAGLRKASTRRICRTPKPCWMNYKSNRFCDKGEF